MRSLVDEFHVAFDLERPPYPEPPTQELARLRLRLIREEFKEVEADFVKLIGSLGSPSSRLPENLEHMRRLLKELADLRYVVEGAAVAMGMDIEGAFEEVHRSNMSKLGEDGRPVKREDGKVLKGPGYTEADMTLFIPEIIEAEEAVPNA